MKSKLIVNHAILFISLFFIGCGGTLKNENKNNATANSLSLHGGKGEPFKIDRKQSVVAWKGSGPLGSHAGYVYISKGELLIENGQLVGGTAEVDMTTIEDDDHGSDNNLINHLKDPDFFDVKKFPHSTIAITRVVSTNGDDKEITCNLTIKGITQPVTFPAKMDVQGGLVKADGRLVIDRTKWNIRYNSGKFFDNLKNQVISDSIAFHITIIARK